MNKNQNKNIVVCPDCDGDGGRRDLVFLTIDNSWTFAPYTCDGCDGMGVVLVDN